MKRFLNRIARSVIAAADLIAQLTDEPSSQAPSLRRGSNIDFSDEQSHKNKDSLSAEAPSRSQQDFIRSESPIPTSLRDPLRDESFADYSQTTAQPDDAAGDPEVLPGEGRISFADTTSLLESDISLDTKYTKGSGHNEIDTEESTVQLNNGLNAVKAFPNSELPLPIYAPAASVGQENHQVARTGETCRESNYSGFDISLSDLEEKSESTWKEELQTPYASKIQPEFEPPGLALYEETAERIESSQASHEFDLDLADLEARQHSTWYASPNEAPAEKSNTSPTNIESVDNEDHKPRLNSQVASCAQRGSICRPGIQVAESLHGTPDDDLISRRIKLRPDGLEELKLRQSGALAWDLHWDPEDYIWALDGAGYFDNIWNVEGFFESMVGEAEDRYYEALYWSEYQGD